MRSSLTRSEVRPIQGEKGVDVMARKAEAGITVAARADRVKQLAEARAHAEEYKPVREMQRRLAPLIEEAKLARTRLAQFDRDNRADLTAALLFLRSPSIQALAFGAGGDFPRRRDAAIAEWSGLLDTFEHNPIRLTRLIDDVERCDPEALTKRPYLEEVVRRDLPEQIATVQSLERFATWRDGYQALLDEIESGRARPREGSWTVPPVQKAGEPMRIHGMDEWDTLNAPVS